MAPLLLEFSNIEVEPLDIVADAPTSEQESGLDRTLAPLGDFEVEALLTSKGVFPVNGDSCNAPCECVCSGTCCCACTS